jgi:phosphomannomutase
LIIMELMAKTGKSLKELIQVIYSKVGAFKFDRDDLHLDDSKITAVLERCANLKEIGGRKIILTETIDGWKYYLDDNTWVMVRPSGTEPVFRVYCQADNKQKVRETLNAAHAALLS